MTKDFSGYGYDLATVEPIPVKSPRFVDTLPTKHHVPTKYLPPVGQQGTEEDPGFPGSCAAWATTYGLATFTAAKKGLVDPKQTSGQASPAYLYIQVLQELSVSSGVCKGSNFKPYFDALNASGTPTMATAPYVANCSELWSTYDNNNYSPVFDRDFKIGKIAAIDVKTSLMDLKQVLASDKALAYPTGLYTDWPGYRGDPVPYVGNGEILYEKDGNLAGHCMLIIGYDDTIGDGAVLIQNSEGTDWGNEGYVLMAYATFQALVSLSQGSAFYVED